MKVRLAQELSGPAGLMYTDVDAGLSFAGLLLLRGEYQLRLEPPFIPVMEDVDECLREDQKV